VAAFVRAELAARAALRENEQLRPFAGRWICQGKHAGAATLEIAAVLDGFWYARQVRAGSFHGVGYWGYDASTQRFVSTFISNRGDFERFTSTGWQGDDFVWTGGERTADGKTVTVRVTFTRHGLHELTRAIDTSATGGAWTRTSEERCRRAP
jgi:hypothetical protein